MQDYVCEYHDTFKKGLCHKLKNYEHFYVWAEYGHLDIVKYYFNQGKDFTIKKNYALRNSARNGHYEVVKFLCENANVDIHARDDYALRHAARNGHYEIVKYLCDNEANIKSGIESIYRKKYYSIYFSIVFGHTKIAKLLIDKITNEELIEIENDLRIMRWACNTNIEFIDYLVNKGIKIKEHFIMKPLCNGKLDIVKYLMKIAEYDFNICYYLEGTKHELSSKIELIDNFVIEHFDLVIDGDSTCNNGIYDYMYRTICTEIFLMAFSDNRMNLLQKIIDNNEIFTTEYFKNEIYIEIFVCRDNFFRFTYKEDETPEQFIERIEDQMVTKMKKFIDQYLYLYE